MRSLLEDFYWHLLLSHFDIKINWEAWPSSQMTTMISGFKNSEFKPISSSIRIIEWHSKHLWMSLRDAQMPSLSLLLLKYGTVRSMTIARTMPSNSQCLPLKPRLPIVPCFTLARCSQAQLILTYARCQRRSKWIRIIQHHRMPTLIKTLETTSSSRKIWISTHPGLTRLKLLGR